MARVRPPSEDVAEALSDPFEVSLLGPLEEFPLDEMGARTTCPADVPTIRAVGDRQTIERIAALVVESRPANDASEIPIEARHTVPVHIVPTHRARANDARNTTLPLAPRPDLLEACRPDRSSSRRGAALRAFVVAIALASLFTLVMRSFHARANPSRAPRSVAAMPPTR